VVTPGGGLSRYTLPSMRTLAAASLASLLTMACLPENPPLEEAASESGETSSEGGERVEDGLLGCPSGESCTIVVVSQTIDDRVDLFTGAGAGAMYRGALELDLKPNPDGDISGENLDEPYGLLWDGHELHVLVGHYPTREVGSLFSFPAASLTDYPPGSTVPSSDWFAGGVPTGLDVRFTPLDHQEPLSLLLHPSSGELLIASFANDLTVPEPAWTIESELLTLHPGASPEGADVGCAGAWSIVALDEDVDAVALACDGDESVAIVETAPVAPRCLADIPFADKRVRYLAPDGLGGVIVGENPVVISGSEDARIWWFDGDCDLRGFSVLEGPSSWELRDLILIPSAAGPRWLLARADGDERGVLILAGDVEQGTVSACGRIDGLDEADAWTASGGVSPLRPHALALTEDGSGLAVGVGPAAYDTTGPGYGSVWWVQLDDAEDACDRTAIEVVELGASAPAVNLQVPLTWRRAPDVVEIIEVAP
jgi:hypothetical protein